MPGKESQQPSAVRTEKQLQKIWPDYQKPVDTGMLISKFSLDDLLRVARVDMELKHLLSIIGFYKF